MTNKKLTPPAAKRLNLLLNINKTSPSKPQRTAIIKIIFLLFMIVEYTITIVNKDNIIRGFVNDCNLLFSLNENSK